MAEVLTSAAVLFSGSLILGSIFSSGILDFLWWAILAYLLIRIIKRDEPRLFLLFGIVAGIALNTQLTVGFFILALAIGLALSKWRKLYQTKWLWLGVGTEISTSLPKSKRSSPSLPS